MGSRPLTQSIRFIHGLRSTRPCTTTPPPSILPPRCPLSTSTRCPRSSPSSPHNTLPDILSYNHQRRHGSSQADSSPVASSSPFAFLDRLPPPSFQADSSTPKQYIRSLNTQKGIRADLKKAVIKFEASSEEERAGIPSANLEKLATLLLYGLDHSNPSPSSNPIDITTLLSLISHLCSRFLPFHPIRSPQKKKPPAPFYLLSSLQTGWMDPSTSTDARLAASIQLERWLERDEVACSFFNSSEREKLWMGCVQMDDKESVAKAYERLDAGVFKVIESKEVTEPIRHLGSYINLIRSSPLLPSPSSLDSVFTLLTSLDAIPCSSPSSSRTQRAVSHGLRAVLLSVTSIPSPSTAKHKKAEKPTASERERKREVGKLAIEVVERLEKWLVARGAPFENETIERLRIKLARTVEVGKGDVDPIQERKEPWQTLPHQLAQLSASDAPYIPSCSTLLASISATHSSHPILAEKSLEHLTTHYRDQLRRLTWGSKTSFKQDSYLRTLPTTPTPPSLGLSFLPFPSSLPPTSIPPLSASSTHPSRPSSSPRAGRHPAPPSLEDGQRLTVIELERIWAFIQSNPTLSSSANAVGSLIEPFSLAGRWDRSKEIWAKMMTSEGEEGGCGIDSRAISAILDTCAFSSDPTLSLSIWSSIRSRPSLRDQNIYDTQLQAYLHLDLIPQLLELLTEMFTNAGEPPAPTPVFDTLMMIHRRAVFRARGNVGERGEGQEEEEKEKETAELRELEEVIEKFGGKGKVKRLEEAWKEGRRKVKWRKPQ